MRLKRRAGLLGGALLTALAATVCSTAFAYFTATGTGAASAEVTQLLTPTILSLVPQPGGSVELSWTAVTAPGPGTIIYSVSRDGGDPGGDCRGATAPSSATSCTDSGVKAGAHTYAVTAKWRSWTASGPPASTEVGVGEATHLTLSAESTAPTAGEADELTIAALDAAGNTVTEYTGAHNLTFSGALPSPGGTAPTVTNRSGTAKSFGSVTAINFSSGVATVTGTKNGTMKLYGAEATEISVSDGSIGSEPGLGITVGSAAATKIALEPASTAPTAGEADNLTTTVTDTYGNAVSTYSGAHDLTFSGASAGPNGDAPTVTDSSGTAIAFGAPVTTNFVAGTATASGSKNGTMKLYKSGSASLKVSDGALTSTAAAVTVATAPTAQLSLAAASTTPVAAASDNLTTTAVDSYGNTTAEYTGTHNLVFSGANASPGGTAPTVVSSTGTATAFGSATAISFSAGVAKVSGSKNGVMKLYKAGPGTISVSDGAIADPDGLAVTVSPTAATKLALTQLTASAGAIDSSCLFACTVTALGNEGTIKANVAVTDTYGNTVSALGKGHAVKVTSTGGTIVGTPLAIPTAGAAESATQFTYTSKSKGNFTDTITAATSEGTTYTSATATASR
jgi:hypothetical protein